MAKMMMMAKVVMEYVKTLQKALHERTFKEERERGGVGETLNRIVRINRSKGIFNFFLKKREKQKDSTMEKGKKVISCKDSIVC